MVALFVIVEQIIFRLKCRRKKKLCGLIELEGFEVNQVHHIS